MAGAFGGSDDDEQENEELAETFEDAINDIDFEDGESDTEEDESEDEEGNDENEDETDDEETDEDEIVNAKDLKAFKKVQFQLEEPILKTKLKLIKWRIEKTKFPVYPSVTEKEKETITKAKRHSNLRKDALEFDTLQVAKKTTWWNDFNTVLGGGGIAILVVAVALIALIVVACLLGGIEADEDDATYSNEFVFQTDALYGARALYKDDTKANIENAKEYYSLILDTENKFGAVDIVEYGGTNYDIIITLNEDAKLADYAWTNLSMLESVNGKVYSFVNSVADKMYSLDNGTASTGLDLTAKLNGIKYLGIDASNVDNLQTLVENYVLINYDFAFVNESYNNIKADIKPSVDNLVKTKVSEALELHNMRTEKLFVKDYVAEEDNALVFEKLNYVSVMYMLKNDIKFSYAHYMLTDIDENNFSISLKNGTEIIALEKCEDSLLEDSVDYDTLNVDLDIPKTQNYIALDTANNVSLLNWLNSVSDKTLYSTIQEIGSQQIYIANVVGLHLEFESETAFKFSEVEVDYETK